MRYSDSSIRIQEDGINLFLDGDTLVLALPPVPDFSHCSRMILDEIGHLNENEVSNILIDCSAVEESQEGGINYFVSLDEYVSGQGIRLLMLDAAPHIYRRFESLFPQAIWIDSSTAGYFGQEMKARANSSL